MQLSLRLSAIAGLVTRGNRLVDVGCDHGYLPVSLYLDGKIPGAIAMDVRKGPSFRKAFSHGGIVKNTDAEDLFDVHFYFYFLSARFYYTVYKIKAD